MFSLLSYASQAVQAPQKDSIWFDHSGHFPFFEEQQKFAGALFQRALPPTAFRGNGD
jgi:hypothetical protein